MGRLISVLVLISLLSVAEPSFGQKEARFSNEEGNSMAITKDMTTVLDGAFIPEVETEMSRRYLMMIQKWIPIILSYFEDWPVRPNCGHFLGGCHWYGIETAVPVKALAAISTSPEYDETITGVSREELRKIAIKGIRYLCFTHDTGPEDCVRPSEGLGRRENWGKKWGERGRGFFPESQCGGTISNITTAALILRPWIDDETWMMLANICMDYLQRFGSMAPKDGVYLDTQMEENAWTSHGLAACYLFLSRHENAGKWEQNAKRWMYSTCSVPQDAKNHARIEDTTASRLTGKTFTALPDYMAENHGMVHPSYTASGVNSVGSLGTIYRLYGRTEPEHAYWNRQVIYDNIKLLTDFTGSPQPIQGMDWPYLSPRCGLHAVAYLYLKDSDAGYFERLALDIAEKIQTGNKGRSINAEIAEKCHGPQDPLVMREIQIGGMADPYLMHRLMGSGAPEPTPAEVMATKLNGVKLFPHSGFVFHRHDHGQTSLAWRNQVMALPVTREGMFTIAPSTGTLLGSVAVKDSPPSQKLRTIRVSEKKDGFAAAMINDLSQDNVRQKVLFASLPNGKVLCNETFTALRDCTVQRSEQGFLKIINENFPEIKENCNGERTLYYPDGQKTFKGFPSVSAEDDVTFELDKPAWINVDDRVGLVFKGTGKTVYINRHFLRPFRAVADDLFLSLQEGEAEQKSGDTLAQLSLLFCPEQVHSETPGAKLIKAESSQDAVCLITDGYMCAGNFAPERMLCSFKVDCDGSVPVFLGTTRVNGSAVEYSLLLEPGEAVYSAEVASVKADGVVKVEALSGGGIYITNEGDRKVRVAVAEVDGKSMTLDIEPGKVAKL